MNALTRTPLDDSKFRAALHADQRRQQRSGKARKRGRTRSNLKYARRPEGWREWLQSLIGRRFRYRTNAIPAHLRPHVPHVRRTLEAGGVDAFAILNNLRDCCTKRQFAAMLARHAVLAALDDKQRRPDVA